MLKLAEFGNAQLFRLITKAKAYIAVGKARDAAALLERLCLYLERDGRVLDHTECLVLSAIVCHLLGVEDRALERMDQALERAHEYGYVRVFSDNGDLALQLLRLYLKDRRDTSSPKTAFAQKTMEAARIFAALYPMLYRQPESRDVQQAALTQTERHILEMLAEGMSNAQIGERLGIKLPTVKFHVSNLLDKLGVKNRTGAVHEGRKQKLIP